MVKIKIDLFRANELSLYFFGKNWKICTESQQVYIKDRMNWE
jgi:hypothetical protein